METRTTRRVGRPRSEAARRAILAAAFKLAAERGEAGLTMEAVARRAGVSKETLYRWWHSKGEVLLDALAERGQREIPIPDTGELPSDLKRFMRATARTLDQPTRRALRTVAAHAASDPLFAEEVRDRFLSSRRAALAAVLQEAVERGELRSDRAATALDLVFGSLWYRLIFAIGPLDQAWADSVAAAVASLGPQARESRVPSARSRG
jgi:AcrR family transcriptional regulator